MLCEDVFYSIYNKMPAEISFCPYRVSPLGAHIDHQSGIITGFAIDRGIHIAYEPKYSGMIELSSVNFDRRARFHVNSVPDVPQNGWADYCRGATRELHARYGLSIGINAVIEGSLPIGGLSSSAAVMIAYMKALSAVNGITLTQQELITMAKDAENNYVGVRCGQMDQYCEVYSRKSHLLYLDCQDNSWDLLPLSPKMPEFGIGIFCSGIQRTLQVTDYNLRQDECKVSAYTLRAFAGLPGTTFQETRLRDVPLDVYHRWSDRLPEKFQKRAAHFFGEMARVRKGVDAWKKGDMKTFGSLIFESGRSSIENYECGSPELITLYTILTETEGVFGGRFSGAGFKGACMALIDPSRSEEIFRHVEERYLRAYPHLEGKYLGVMCHSADGAGM